MSPLFLYHLTLKHPSLSLHTVVGQFSNKKNDLHLVVSSSSGLQVFHPDAQSGKLQPLTKQNAFAHLTNMAKARCSGDNKDVLVVVSDSGNLSVCELDAASNTFVARDQVALGKSGMTRFSPCSYVAANAKSHHVMVSGLERIKLVYNIDSLHQAPVEHIAKNTWTLSLVALDTNHENSVWAALEVAADRPKEPCLNYYVLDHGLNHIFSRKSSVSVPSASLVVPMPGHLGGVVVCCESYLIYDAEYANSVPGSEYKSSYKMPVYVGLPVRRNSKATVITSAQLHTLKKNDFFILLQSSSGDLFKLTASREPHIVLRVSYFDSLPPCTSFDILKSGFLYANTLRNDKLFYQFESLGDENDTTQVSTDCIPPHVQYFDPIGLQNLALVDILPSLGPLFDAGLVGSQTPDTLTSLLTLSSHSYLKTLTHGYPITQLVSSPLPSTPSVIYTTKLYRASLTDQYLVLSSARDETTSVLSIGEVVEEAETELVKNQYTLGVQQTGQSSLVQIHRNGIRSIRHVIEDGIAKMVSYSDWFPPAGITILHCSSNNEQVIVALSNREVCYFEIDADDDQLIEYQDRMQVVEGSITAIALDVGGAKKSKFAAVASSDHTVQVVSLAPHNCFSVLTLQALSFGCRSLLLSSSFLHMGMDNGVYVRVAVDSISGKLSDTRSKYLGAKPVDLRPFKLPNTQKLGILAISAKPWIGHFDQSGNLRLSPLIDCNITCGSSFFSEDIGIDSVVGIEGNNLTIFTVGTESGFDANEEFQISQVKLRYSPKKMVRTKNLVFIMEADCNTVSPYVECDRVEASNTVSVEASNTVSVEASNTVSVEASNTVSVEASNTVSVEASNTVLPDADSNTVLPNADSITVLPNADSITLSLEAGAGNTEVDSAYYDAFGYQQMEGRWASCVQVVDHTKQQVVQTIEIQNNECAVAMTSDSQGHVMVATTQDMNIMAGTSSANYIYSFRVSGNGLQLLHKTKVDAMVTALSEFSSGRLLVASHNRLRLYEMGQKQLLQKCVSKIEYLRRITQMIYLGGDTVVVGDGQASVSYVRLDAGSNRFFPLISDIVPRQITALESLDNRTVVAGDKFGNISVSRIGDYHARDFNENVLSQFQDEFLGGPSARLDKVCEFHISDIPTSFSKGSFVQGGTEGVVYTGVQGTVGILLPMATVQEAKMMVRLETLMREVLDPEKESGEVSKLNLVGRDHLKFRGYYNPVQNVIDGDFVELFYNLDQATKVKIAGGLDRTPREIERKLYDLRNRGAF